MVPHLFALVFYTFFFLQFYLKFSLFMLKNLYIRLLVNNIAPSDSLTLLNLVLFAVHKFIKADK